MQMSLHQLQPCLGLILKLGVDLRLSWLFWAQFGPGVDKILTWASTYKTYGLGWINEYPSPATVITTMIKAISHPSRISHSRVQILSERMVDTVASTLSFFFQFLWILGSHPHKENTIHAMPWVREIWQLIFIVLKHFLFPTEGIMPISTEQCSEEAFLAIICNKLLQEADTTRLKDLN